jgi:hypothetical protein
MSGLPAAEASIDTSPDGRLIAYLQPETQATSEALSEI